MKLVGASSDMQSVSKFVSYHFLYDISSSSFLHLGIIFKTYHSVAWLESHFFVHCYWANSIIENSMKRIHASILISTTLLPNIFELFAHILVSFSCGDISFQISSDASPLDALSDKWMTCGRLVCVCAVLHVHGSRTFNSSSVVFFFVCFNNDHGSTLSWNVTAHSKLRGVRGRSLDAHQGYRSEGHNRSAERGQQTVNISNETKRRKNVTT